MSKITEDYDNEKKIFKAEARAKAHLKLSVSRSTSVTSGFAHLRASVTEDTCPNHSHK